MNLYQPTISGSLVVSGSVSVIGPFTMSGGSITGTASFASNSGLLSNLDSGSFVGTGSYNTLSSSFTTVSSSYSAASGSFSTRVTTLETASGSFSGRVSKIEGNYATTGSNIFTGAQTVCANITSTGTIIAQTLNVQQVTSSVVYSSGSNIFGCALINTQQFTGSVTMTGSLAVFTAGTSPEFQVAVGGNTLGNALTDVHQVTGSLRVTGSMNITNFISSSGNLRIDKDLPDIQMNILSSSEYARIHYYENNVGRAGTQLIGSAFPGTRKCRFEIFGPNSGMSFIPNGQFESPVMFLTGSNVGIGTCTPAYTLSTQGTGDHRLYHYNSGNTSGDRSVIQAEVCGDTSGNAFFAAAKTGVGWSFGRNTTTGNFEVRSNFDLANDTQTRFQITSTGISCFRCQICAPAAIFTGCVGIGTTTPATALHVSGSGDTTLTISISGANNPRIKFCGGPGVINRGATGDNMFFGEDADTGNYLFRGSNFVGIGTSSPGAKLDVCQMGGDRTRACNALYLRAGGNADSFCHNQILFGYNGTTDYAHAIKTRHQSNNACENGIDFFTWKFGDAAGTRAGQYVMTIAGNGNVGIGACIPNTKLEIINNTTNEIRLWSTAGTYRSFIGFRTDGEKWNVGVNLNDVQDALSFNYQSSEKIRVNTTGNLILRNPYSITNLSSTATTTLISGLPTSTSLLISVTIQWASNGAAQRTYLLHVGATNTGWGSPNSGITTLSSLDWSSGYVGAATFAVGGSGSDRTLTVSVANANVYSVNVYASMVQFG